MPVFPLAPRSKKPLISKEHGGNGFYDATANEEQVAAWWDENPDANIGMPTGALSDRVVIDPDSRNGGDETLRDLELHHGPLPDTLTSVTPGGEHRVFRYPGARLPATLGDGVDVKSDGGYVVLPPSVHPSGATYQWDAGYTDIAELPEWIVALARDEKPSDPIVISNFIPIGRRHDELLRWAGFMRQKGASEAMIYASLIELNAERCERPLADSEVKALARDVAARWQPGEAFIHSNRSGLGAQRSSKGKADHLNCEPVIVTLADVPREDVAWRWRDRLPLGKLTLIEGDPGVGKSQLSLAIATAVTLGHPLPGDGRGFEPRNVLMMSAEDGVGDTLRPRLEDMGADLQRTKILTSVRDDDGRERFPSLVDDMASIEKALGSGGYGLVIIDPINAYLGGVDGHADVDVRSALRPLAHLAERWSVSVVCIRHITKSPRDKAIYRGSGSIAYTAAARSVLLVGRNPNNERESVAICIKHNLAPDSRAIAFEIGDGLFLWRGESDVTAAQLLAPDENEERRDKLTRAIAFLCGALSVGSRRAQEMIGEAKANGITLATLYRAKEKLGVVVERRGEPGRRGAGSWWWTLPATTSDLDDQVLTEEKVISLTRHESDGGQSRG